LSEAEAAEWRTAAAQASAEHSFLWAFGYHCADEGLTITAAW
jgi:hypothetical protein